MSHSSRQKKIHEAHPATSVATTRDTPRTAEPDAGLRQPTADLIRQRAYEISQARNGGPGNAQADWTQAEQELAAVKG